MSAYDWPDLAAETRDVWNRNADLYDERMGDDGNDWHRKLIRPGTERLLDIRPGERVLEVACGTGLFARRLAALGARVLAFDVSDRMIGHARRRSRAQSDRIDYRVIDAADRDQLQALHGEPFDAAVANMALMDVPSIEPLSEALSGLLRPGGRFVFSVMHPCFQAPGMTKVAEETEADGRLLTRFSVKVSEYATPKAHLGMAILGQPVPQHYFHRPLSTLFAVFFDAGFVLTGLEEPTFGPDTEPTRLQGWINRPEIPPVFIARMVLPAR